LRSHWMTEMLREGHGQEHRQDTGSWVKNVMNGRADSTHLMAPSKVPGRKPKPCPISWRNKSPSTSLSRATSVRYISASSYGKKPQHTSPLGNCGQTAVIVALTSALSHRRSRFSLTQHTRRDIHPHPNMSLLLEHLPAQTAPTPNIKHERRLVLWQSEEFERSRGHLRLDRLDTRARQGVEQL
jgi:hypothetical protein